MKRHLVVRCSILLMALLSTPALIAQQVDTIYSEDVQLVAFEDLAYPRGALVGRVQGVVVIRAVLNDKGEVVNALALQGNRTLIPECLANVKKWRFKPNPRKSAIVVYDFRLDDGVCKDNSHSLFRLWYGTYASITACAPLLQ